MRSNNPFRFTVFLFAMLVVAPWMPAQEWTRFRGPNGTGVSDDPTIPVQWTEKDYCWKAELPGVGHSSPVVWGDRVFLLSGDPDKATRYVLCYRATDGKLLWSKTFASQTHRLHVRSSYASSTPTVDADRVYVAWGTPGNVTLKAFDHEGGEVWSRDLGRWVGQHGFGTSPILYENMVILHNSQQADQLDPGDQPGQSTMLALDRRTGEDVWQTPLKTIRVCYSVPFFRKSSDGSTEMVCTSTGAGVFGLDPLTGRMKWSIDVFKMRVVNSPIEAAGLIFTSNGSGGYSSNFAIAVKPGPDPQLAYTLKNSSTFKAPYVTCLLPMDRWVFAIYDRGYVSCIDAATGEVQWLERIRAAFNASPVRVRDKIYCMDEEGTVWVLAANPEKLRVLAKNPLGEPSRSTPAISEGRMFLRTYSHLICVSGK
ncbi:MAG: PQQ-binding-like beta-propeller repeat protein [Pirellulaceae bacterium]